MFAKLQFDAFLCKKLHRFISSVVHIVLMTSKRTTALMQIMQIDDKMSQISKSKRYQKIQQYTRLLKNIGGKAVVRVENPSDMGRLEDVRRNSPKAKQYLK